MKYWLFFLFLASSFVMADDGTLGVVRILNTQPPQYDSNTGKIIPDSMNTILHIQKIQFDRRIPGRVALVAAKEDLYDALLISFPDSNTSNAVPQKFGKLLYENPNFKVDVIEQDLEFDSTMFLSILKISAEDVRIRAGNTPKATLLKELICPMTTKTGLLPWTSAKRVRADCL